MTKQQWTRNISVKTVQQFGREGNRNKSLYISIYLSVDLANSGKRRMYVCIFNIEILFFVYLIPELRYSFFQFFSNISLVQIYRCISIQSCLSFTVICRFHFFFLYIYSLYVCPWWVSCLFLFFLLFFLSSSINVACIELFVLLFSFYITWRFRTTNKTKITTFIFLDGIWMICKLNMLKQRRICPLEYMDGENVVYIVY